MTTKHHYHSNAIGTSGYLLEEYEAKAKTQDQVILGLFHISKCTLSPSIIYRLMYEEIPITSIRRALSNLTRDGYLIKQTRIKVSGMYNRLECTWILNTDLDNG